MGFILGIIVGIAMLWVYLFLYVKSRIHELEEQRQTSLQHRRIIEANEFEARIIELKLMKFGLSDKK